MAERLPLMFGECKEPDDSKIIKLLCALFHAGKRFTFENKNLKESP
jgi:hypothetical protein